MASPTKAQLQEINELSRSVKWRMKKHAITGNHTRKHINAMIKALKAGRTVSRAHNIALKTT